MAKKTKTIEYRVCDFCETEVEAVEVVQPSGKDACAMHMKAFTEEVRLPDELGGDMSGMRTAVEPGYEAKMVIEYKKEK
jgi:hypothetical protein